MNKVSVNNEKQVGEKCPVKRIVKVTDCQLCGGTIHNYLNSISQRIPWRQFMIQFPDDPRIPLMTTMLEMDKQFQEKLSPLIDMKINMDKSIKDLILDYCSEIVIKDNDNPNLRETSYVFRNDGKYKEYSEKLIEMNNDFMKNHDEFEAGYVEIEPIYCNKLPHFNHFENNPELRNPLKGFILPLD